MKFSEGDGDKSAETDKEINRTRTGHSTIFFFYFSSFALVLRTRDTHARLLELHWARVPRKKETTIVHCSSIIPHLSHLELKANANFIRLP